MCVRDRECVYVCVCVRESVSASVCGCAVCVDVWMCEYGCMSVLGDECVGRGG